MTLLMSNFIGHADDSFTSQLHQRLGFRNTAYYNNAAEVAESEKQQEQRDILAEDNIVYGLVEQMTGSENGTNLIRTSATGVLSSNDEDAHSCK